MEVSCLAYCYYTSDTDSFPAKACEKQKASWDAANALMEEFTDFLDVTKHATALQEKVETSRAVVRMLKSIRTACEYVRDNTSPNVLGKVHGRNIPQVYISHSYDAGNLFGAEYHSKITSLKEDFGRAKNAFDQSIALEAFKMISGMGK